MLFNSVFFICIFLPIALLGFYLLQKMESPIFSQIFLICMSLWFYGYYNVSYVTILVASILINYSFSYIFKKTDSHNLRKATLHIGILANVGILFYFKYFNFFIDNCNYLLHSDIHIEKIALPLGISFFTFQQLSYIIERYENRAEHLGFIEYSCFITFFPQLIAGPIVLHNEFIPQLRARKNRTLDQNQLYVGMQLFALGFAKKVLLADSLAMLVNAEYNNIQYLDSLSAWVTITFYMLELYFDFSGYCDMARAIGMMFGFVLPENFNSPLLSTSVKDFWRRWHITLSRFLTTYIYIPLGGNRKGLARKCLNLFIVFLVSGIWHGANWTFIVWGVLHGLAMIFESVFPGFRFKSERLNRAFTFLFVTLSFSIFRSDSLSQAMLLLKKLFLGGWNGMLWGISCTLQFSETYILQKALSIMMPGVMKYYYLGLLILLLVISFCLIRGKKAMEFIKSYGSSLRGNLIVALLFVWSFVSLSQVTVFLYFNF